MAIFDEELRALKDRVLKIGSLIEAAIRDSVKSLVERNSELARKVIEKEPQLKPYIDIPRMAEIAEGMVRDSLDAFVMCSKLPYDVIKKDDEVDNLNAQ